MRIWWPFSWKGVSENPGLPTPFNKLPKLLSQVAMSTERWSVPAQLCWPHLPALVPWAAPPTCRSASPSPSWGEGSLGDGATDGSPALLQLPKDSRWKRPFPSLPGRQEPSCVIPRFTRWSPNPQHPQMGPYLETDSSQRPSS